MGDGIGEQAVVRFLRDRGAGETGDLRSPGVGNRVARQLHDVELLRQGSSVKRDEVGEFLDRGGRVFGSQRLMRGLEVDVQVHSGFVAFIFLEDARDDGAGEARLGIDERECLGGKAVGIGFLRGWILGDRGLSTSDHEHVGRDGAAPGATGQSGAPAELRREIADIKRRLRNWKGSLPG